MYIYTNLLEFQNVLFSIGSAFLYYVNHFKLYSSFCASHSKAQKVLHPSEYANEFLFRIHPIRAVFNLTALKMDGLTLLTP